MLKYLETKSPILNENTFSDKFTDKRVLVMGSGPSVNSVKWEELEYDAIVTTTFFYLNDKVRNLKIQWSEKSSITIVLCAKGYPSNYIKNSESFTRCYIHIIRSKSIISKWS